MYLSKVKEVYTSYLQEEAFRKIAVYTFFGFLPVLSGFLLTPVYTRLLSQAEYGKLSYLNVLQGYFTLLVFLGLDNSLTRYYFQFKGDKEKVQTMFASVFQFVFAFSVLIVSVIYIADRFGWIIHAKMYGLIIGNVLFTAIVTAFLNYSRDGQKLKQFTVISTFQFIGLSVGSLTGILFITPTAEGCYWGRLILLAVLSLLLSFYQPRYFFSKPDIRLLPRLLSFGMSFIPYSLIGTLYDSIDRILIEKKFTYETLAVYNIAFVVSFLVNILVNALMQTYNPKIFLLLEGNQTGEDLALLRKKMFNWASLGVILLSILCYPFIYLFAGKIYLQSIPYVPVLSFCFLLRLYYIVYSVPIFFYKKTVFLPVIIGLSLLAFFLFYWIFSGFGIPGILLALILGRFVQAASSYFLSKKYFHTAQDIFSGIGHKKVALVGIVSVIFSVGYNLLINKSIFTW